MMAHPMPAVPLSRTAALETAQDWCEQALSLNQTAQLFHAAAASLSEAANSLVVTSGLSPQNAAPAPSLPAGVADFAAYRSRRTGVTR